MASGACDTEGHCLPRLLLGGCHSDAQSPPQMPITVVPTHLHPWSHSKHCSQTHWLLRWVFGHRSTMQHHCQASTPNKLCPFYFKDFWIYIKNCLILKKVFMWWPRFNKMIVIERVQILFDLKSDHKSKELSWETLCGKRAMEVWSAGLYVHSAPQTSACISQPGFPSPFSSPSVEAVAVCVWCVLVWSGMLRQWRQVRHQRGDWNVSWVNYTNNTFPYYGGQVSLLHSSSSLLEKEFTDIERETEQPTPVPDLRSNSAGSWTPPRSCRHFMKWIHFSFFKRIAC